MPRRAKPLELTRPFELACVDAAEPAIGDKREHGGLGRVVVRGDEDVERVAVDLAGDERPGESGVEGLDHLALRQKRGDLLRGALCPGAVTSPS